MSHKKLLTIAAILISLFPALVFASKTPIDNQKSNILKKFYRIQIPFIENKGQVVNKDVSFYAKTFGGALFVEKNGILTYSLPYEDKGRVILREIFTDKKVEVKGLEPSATRISYFKGNDKSKWRTNIPSYESISLGEIYEGINLTIKAYGNNVEKLFTVVEGGKPEDIAIKVEGVKGLKVNESGELEAITELGAIKFTNPKAYQEINGKKIDVIVSYHLLSFPLLTQYAALGTPHSSLLYGFKVGKYDKKRPLIIDPLLASTFIGGGDSDVANSLALDGSGNVYVTGGAMSADFPTTPGAYDESYNGGYGFYGDVFVSKFDNNLSSLLSSTFIGGSSADECYSLALDGSGNVYIAGSTMSSDFPTTPGAYDESYNGGLCYDVLIGSDGFISKLNNNLSTLLGSSFIGGSCFDDVRYLALDKSGNVYVTGGTISADFPTTPGSYDESLNGYGDGFVSKLDGGLSTLLASTFIGGSEGGSVGFLYDVVSSLALDGSGNVFLYDVVSSLALDGSGNVYIAGSTMSSDFPTISGAYDESLNGYGDGFVSKLDSSLSNLLASTFIGGNEGKEVLYFDTANSLALDENGNVYVAGGTTSSDFPTTPGAYDESYNGGYDLFTYGDGFILKLNNNLSTLLASTLIGGSLGDSAGSLALDGGGNVYVTGGAQSADFPTTPGAYDNKHSGIFISKLNSSLNILIASTFIGGSELDSASSLALDGNGNVYIAGCTGSSDYPASPGAYDESYNGGLDVFISKLDNNLSSDIGITTTTSTGLTTTIISSTTTTTMPCLVETIYGEHSQETELLRCFRDEILIKTPEGEECIQLYYELSSIVVKTMEANEEFKKEIKKLIDGILPLVKIKGE